MEVAEFLTTYVIHTARMSVKHPNNFLSFMTPYANLGRPHRSYSPTKSSPDLV
jgi:hypothetical protein